VGISWLLEQRNALELVTHTGNVSNVSISSLTLAPTRDFAVVVLTNSRAGTGLCARVTDWAIEHFLDEGPRESLPALSVTPEDLTEYAGRYDSGQWYLDVSCSADRLVVQLVITDVEEGQEGLFDVPPIEVVLVGPDQVALAAAPTEIAGDFLRDRSGRIRSLRWGLRDSPRLP
jgi:hypothetical protein